MCRDTCQLENLFYTEIKYRGVPLKTTQTVCFETVKLTQR